LMRSSKGASISYLQRNQRHVFGNESPQMLLDYSSTLSNQTLHVLDQRSVKWLENYNKASIFKTKQEKLTLENDWWDFVDSRLL
jgi:hypothetical protein